MIRPVRVLAVCGVLMAGGLFASTACAQNLGCGLGAGAYGLGFYNYGYGSGIDTPRLPYYAVYPPVYYSYIVPRPYGYSPFAYPPGTLTPEVPPAPAAATIYNPFVKPKTEQSVAAPLDRSASAPRTYLNPFVKQARTASEVAVAEAAVR